MSELVGGVKNDKDKLDRYDLIPPEALRALAELYGRGAKKYADRNWEKGISFGRVFRAMMSHAWKWWRGEEYDPEDGQHHLDSVAWCAFALRTYMARGMIEFDTRGIQKEKNGSQDQDVKAEGPRYEYPTYSTGSGGPVVSGYFGSANR